ncbi:MAG: type-X family DNA polymerase [bacterium]|nr:type-X family DNA polymerase [bacterium]
MENNKVIASMFRQIAALLDEQGVAFKPAAYRRGAQVLEELDRDVSEFDGVKSLKALPGIGDAMAAKIVQYLETGEIEFLGTLRAQQGGLPAELMDIEGLGPKRVRQIQMELGVNTVEGLIKAAEEGKLRTLPRFSELMESKVLEWAKRRDERVKRFDRAEVTGDVEMLLKTISAVDGVDKCAVAGSYRREKPTVGDIDILVVTKSSQEVLRRAQHDNLIRNVVAHGDTKISFDLHNGLRVDVRFVKRAEWGSALMYFTGSKEHNIAVRKVAISKGWKLNEYGLYDGEEIVAQREEEDIYSALGLRYYEPKERVGSL